MNSAMIKKVANVARFQLAKAKRKTVRYYCGNLPAFYNALTANKIEYVVLRWADKVPVTPEEERVNTDDVDHLIADDKTKIVASIAAPFGGGTKCDWYSVSGQSGSGYLAMPYYMPVLAQKILESRWLDPRGFYRPNAMHEFLAFAYHLVYHKGHRCGIPTGCDVSHSSGPKSKYIDEFHRLAAVASQDIPNDVTLFDMHSILKEHGWAMPVDLMLRWPDRHGVIMALLEIESTHIRARADQVKDLTVFVLRDDCDTPELEEIARNGISERFEILTEFVLSPEQRARVMSQTRGGNWIERRRKDPVEPTRVLVCKNALTPGPLPYPVSAKKLKSKYPLLENTDVLIKRVIREAVNKAAQGEHKRVVIHATDNPTEAAETLSAIYAKQYDAEIAKLAM